MTDTTYLTVEEAATRLGKTTRTLWRWIKQDEEIKKLLPTVTAKERGLVGGNPDKIFLREEDVEAMAKKLAEGKSSSTQHAEASHPHDVDIPMTSPDTMSTELQQLQQKVTDQAGQMAHLNTVLYAFMKSVDEQLHDLREVEIKTLQDRINELTEQLALQRAVKAVQTTEAQEGVPEQVPLKNGQNAHVEATETPASAIAPFRIVMQSPTDKPPDAIPLHQFVKALKADGFSINARTFRDRVDAEFAHYGYYHEARDEWQRYVTPEQQETIRKALQGKQQSPLPDGWVPLNTFAKEHGLNRNELEQLGHQGIIHGVEHGKWITSAGKKVHLALSSEGQKNALKYYHKE